MAGRGNEYISLARDRVGGDWNARDLPLVIYRRPKGGKTTIVDSILRVLAAKGVMVSSIFKERGGVCQVSELSASA